MQTRKSTRKFAVESQNDEVGLVLFFLLLIPQKYQVGPVEFLLSILIASINKTGILFCVNNGGQK